MTYTWEAATNRLVGFARDTGSIFTTTLQYDSLNRIVARYTATYSTTYTYVGDSDWLLKETKYPFGGAAFDLVQYRYISPKLMRIALRDGGACNSVIYLQMNWHGDFYRDYTANGDSFTVQQGDEWGNWPRARLACNTPHAYHWNAQWGYQFFDELGAPNGGNPPLGDRFDIQ